jgi:hypothetical protein
MPVKFNVGDTVGQTSSRYNEVRKGEVIKVTASGRIVVKMFRDNDPDTYEKTFTPDGRPFPKEGFTMACYSALKPWDSAMQTMWDSQVAKERASRRRRRDQNRRERADAVDLKQALEYAMLKIVTDPDPRAERARKFLLSHIPQHV